LVRSWLAWPGWFVLLPALAPARQFANKKIELRSTNLDTQESRKDSKYPTPLIIPVNTQNHQIIADGRLGLC
jgi:hypothetical protein